MPEVFKTQKEVEKVRGITYKETELAGKPFIIAERLQPKKTKETPVVQDGERR